MQLPPAPRAPFGKPTPALPGDREAPRGAQCLMQCLRSLLSVLTRQPPPLRVLLSCVATAHNRHGWPALSPVTPRGSTSGAHLGTESCHTQPPACTYLLSGLLLSGHRSSVPTQFLAMHESSSLHTAPRQCRGEDRSQVRKP